MRRPARHPGHAAILAAATRKWNSTPPSGPKWKSLYWTRYPKTEGRMLVRFSALALAGCLCIAAQSPREIQVSAASVWTDSGIDVKPGDTLRFTATGTLQYDNSK